MCRKVFFYCFVIFLSACGTLPQPTIGPTQEIVLRPIATRTASPLPTPTPIPATTTVLPSPTTDPNFFRDDFIGTLESKWTWVREDPLNWSLATVPGSLQINVVGGYVPQHTNSNVLLRPAPSGDFQIETQITFSPQDNFQFAGLIVYESDTDFIQAGRSYCHTFACVGEGLYMNAYKKGVLVPPDFGQSYRDSNPILLRLSRRGETYTFEVNTNGKVWFVIGSHTSDMKPLQVGLVVGQNLKGHVLPALFDYFEVRSLP